MNTLRNFEREAIHTIYTQAIKHAHADKGFIDTLLHSYNLDADALISKILSMPITLNFHPDRLCSNGQLIIESMLNGGQYLGQFHTGTTNGGKTAYIGGERFLWEQQLFSDTYPEDTLNRPKYGALNILNYLDGAAARFGSCYFTLKPSNLSRCTFAYGDSCNQPTKLGTHDSFYSILAALLKDVSTTNQLLDRDQVTLHNALTTLLTIETLSPTVSRNLDHYIETHIHGDLLLSRDIDALYLDSSFMGTTVQVHSEALCHKYGISLHWIPKRVISIDAINDHFRGPMIKPLAQKIDFHFGNHSGHMDAYLIGKGSCSSIQSPEEWSDIGIAEDCFQYFKQLWHTVAFYHSC